MESTFRLGRIFGIPIGVHYSWFLIFFMLTYMLSDDLGEGFRGWSLAVFTSLLFFASVLVHELSHSVVAMARGIPVKGITLFIFGGVAQIAREANRPSTELMVAAVGPLSSILLGLLFWAVHIPLEGVSRDLARMAALLAYWNVVVGVFNLAPGFPLDGGRVFRAILWWVSHNYQLATRIAIRSGQLVALLLIGLGVAVIVIESPSQGMWYIFIGLFLGSAASSSYRQFRQRESLRYHVAGEIMRSQCITIPAGLTLSQVAQSYGRPSESTVFLVVEAGHPIGLLDERSFASVPRGRWNQTTVEQQTSPLEEALTVAPQDDALSVLEMMEEKDVTQALVISNGSLLGCVGRDSFSSFKPRHRNA